jgi:superfamily II DNA or RNA helicase
VRDEKKSEIQSIAIEKWLENGKVGTVELVTGLGKTFIFLHALHTMRKDNKIHLFLAETTEREKDLLTDVEKFDKMFGYSTLKDYNLKFYCYQTVYKWKDEKFGLVGCDEIHDMLSPEYSKFAINNQFDAILGMSATINRNTSYEIDGKVVTKGQMIDRIAPVIYRYTINQGQTEGTSRKLNVYIIHQELDSVNKNVKAGSLKKPFLQTEKDSYTYWDKEHKRSWFIEDEEMKNLKIRITSTKRSNLLFNLPSKITSVKKLLTGIKGKSILFGNSLDSLLKVTPNVVSSRYSEEQNKAIRDNFDEGRINLIGSFKKLRQGANLSDLDNCIVMSYYGSEVHAIQQWGRLRKNGDKVGSIFILLTDNTQEVIWYNKMIENVSDFNMIDCKSVEDCLNIYNNE